MKNIGELGTELEQAYATLTICIGEQATAEANLASAQAWLEESRNAILVKTAPKELGANEAQREAKLYILCEEQVSRVQQAEQSRLLMRAQTERARLLVESLRCQLRIVEVGAGVRAAA